MILDNNLNKLYEGYKDDGTLQYMLGKNYNFEEMWKRSYENLQSEGIIKVAGDNKIKFFHRSFFKYASAKCLLNYNDKTECLNNIEKILDLGKRYIYLNILNYMLLSTDITNELRKSILEILISSKSNILQMSAIDIYAKLPTITNDERNIINKLKKSNNFIINNYYISKLSSMYSLKYRKREVIETLLNYSKIEKYQYKFFYTCKKIVKLSLINSI